MISINMKKGEWKGQRSQTNSDLLLYLPNNYSWVEYRAGKSYEIKLIDPAKAEITKNKVV